MLIGKTIRMEDLNEVIAAIDAKMETHLK